VALPFADHDLGSEGGLRPAQQRCQHLAGLVGVVVDRLLAEDDELRRFLLRHGREQLGYRQRLQIDVGLDQDGAIGADGHRGAQGFLASRDAAGNGDHLRRGTRFLEAHRLFHSDLVEGVHRHFHIRQIDTSAVCLDANLDVVVNHALDRDEDFQATLLKFAWVKESIVASIRQPISIRYSMECEILPQREPKLNTLPYGNKTCQNPAHLTGS
jgi:hypothetical protein